MPVNALAAVSLASELDVLDDPAEQVHFTRWMADASGQRLGESAFQVGGMVCAACAGLIESALCGVDGVLDAQVSAAGHRALVRWDPSRTQVSSLVKAVRAAGYEAVPDAAAPARELRRSERRLALWRLFVASFCAMQVMMFATPSYVASGADLAPDLRQLLNWGSWLVALPALVFSAGPFFRGAWHSLKARRIGMDLPVALGLLVTFVASSGATFAPDGVFGHEVYFDSFTMFISFLLGARFLEMSTRHRAAEALETSLAALPESARRLTSDGTVEVVSVQRLRPGDRVQVPMGAAVPADGTLEVGATEVSEALLTGESHPVAKAFGDGLVGGSINLGAPVVMRVERVGVDTRYAQLVMMMRSAMSQRPALARRADAWAGPFLWAVLLLAAGAAAVWSVIDPSRAVWVAVSVLIVTCPCALSLAAPSALVAATGALARRGVMLQRLDALEALARLQHLFIDKTGTLTEDKPAWVGTQALDDQAVDPQMLASALALAAWSTHPLSRALTVPGGADGVADPADADPDAWSDIEERAGEGLQASDAQGRLWRLGSLCWVSDGPASGSVPAADALPAVWFGPVGQALLRFDFDERLRPDAAMALHSLAADGVQLTLLSGDQPARARRLAMRLGVGKVIGHATPQDKLDAVAAAQARGEVVGMVGDGVNDAPVLGRADVSFAMGQGALVARAHADAVITSSRLADLAMARQLARRTMAVVRQNLWWAAAYNAVCIPAAAMGWLPPWAAGLGMALSSMVVVANSWRLSRLPLPLPQPLPNLPGHTVEAAP
jgi:Cu2+-exporting ATPase